MRGLAARLAVLLTAVSLGIYALLAGGCAPAPTPPLPGSSILLSDADALADFLAQSGVNLGFIGEAEYDWFEEPGRVYEVRTEPEGPPDILYIHTYEDEQALHEELARIDPEGNRVTLADGRRMRVEWLGSPHIYADGQLLVVYVGRSKQVADVLAQALGPQVAGASIVAVPDIKGGK
jgi:hypothetical protein